MTIQEAKTYGKQNLLSSPTPELDTAVILQHITGFDKTHLLLNRDYELTAEQEADFLSAIEKRKTGLPIAYITGHKEFFGYDFYVSPDVLIPKPDTELLVELALDALEDKFRAHPDQIPTVCDMCTGSGCVGLSIIKELEKKQAEIKLTLADISEKALNIAKINAQNLLKKEERSKAPSQKRTSEAMSSPNQDEMQAMSSLEPGRDAGNVPNPIPNSSFLIPHSLIFFVQTNLFENIPHSFDLIVTNPPYVPHEESLELLKDGRSEPLLALDGDVDLDGSSSGSNDGLGLIRHLVGQAYQHLNPKGVLLMETGEYNALETAELFKKAGFRNVEIHYDMNEMMRDVSGIK